MYWVKLLLDVPPCYLLLEAKGRSLFCSIGFVIVLGWQNNSPPGMVLIYLNNPHSSPVMKTV